MQSIVPFARCSRSYYAVYGNGNVVIVALLCISRSSRFYSQFSLCMRMCVCCVVLLKCIWCTIQMCSTLADDRGKVPINISLSFFEVTHTHDKLQIHSSSSTASSTNCRWHLKRAENVAATAETDIISTVNMPTSMPQHRVRHEDYCVSEWSKIGEAAAVCCLCIFGCVNLNTKCDIMKMKRNFASTSPSSWDVLRFGICTARRVMRCVQCALRMPWTRMIKCNSQKLCWVSEWCTSVQ